MQEDKRISDVISHKDIENWKIGDIVTIRAKTGMGKSYFIMNKLYEYCKENNLSILLLTHRKNCKIQFSYDIEGKEDVITLETYQKIENSIDSPKRDKYDISRFDIIVCDEYHYFFEDSSFNHNTDLSLYEIIEARDSIRIMMSATGDDMKLLLNTHFNIDTVDYYIESTHTNISNIVYFYDGKNHVFDYLDKAMNVNSKSIFFIQSAKMAYELHLKYPNDTLFVCSDSSEYAKFMDFDEKNDMLKEEKFNKKILITTTTLDAGINIVDRDVKHIVCFVSGVSTLVQCLGRKRSIDKEDKFEAIISVMNNNKLGGIMTSKTQKIENAELVYSGKEREFLKNNTRYKRIDKEFIYNEYNEKLQKVELKVYELRLFKQRQAIKEIEKILGMKGGYIAYLNEVLEVYKFNIKYGVLNGNSTAPTPPNELEDFLLKFVGEMIYGDDKRKNLIIEKINCRDNRKRLVKNIDKLNAHLIDLKLCYKLTKKVDNRRKVNGIENVNYKKGYWVINNY